MIEYHIFVYHIFIMTSQINLRTGKDYQSCFDSNSYLNVFYSKVEGPIFIEFVVDSLHKIYSTGQIKGNRLVDIGSGPCIHMVIPAAKWFDEIVLSDYSPTNRELLQKWLNKDRDAHDWTPFFHYFSNLDKNEQNSGDLEDEIRKKINRVVQCDVHLSNPLQPLTFEGIDVISTSLCLESASSNVDEYTQAMKNVVSLLNKNGKLIIMGVLNNPFYTVGKEKFRCLSLEMSNVLAAIESSGLKVIQSFYDKSHLDGDFAPYDGAFVILAEKV